MRRKDSYYLKLEKKVNRFLKTLDNEELFVLKAIIRTRHFKAYLKEQESLKKQPSFFEYKNGEYRILSIARQIAQLRRIS